ncbi:class I SAM-dependent methyltransferase [Actinoalloteichus sp. AHMU CJ021]|uniref:Methyltransferase domain-containing protein n=1 Tax=Actinoalloteichus caeruleus DSM 43889 TaxID=1120930 RepID=A0ABT1JDE8_ACTCY|nr:class I SAM-dependent methyltransferase [Actinoalloteichus caeruleus]AUS80994.1 class I SAM-dependent methyltransferase [Actinoalloteichus sp. AHMU CJ021]MCP2330453.1 Methyltransferase domain-containing protein [Actinoalloteichus caeruleus DSM 43889]
MSTAASQDEQFWNDLYDRSDRIWSGRPNAALVRETTDLSPGHALDLGCGEGGDAVWLASRGWRVTATDISRVALARTRRHADEAGVGHLVDDEHHDLAVSFPAGEFDLVSAQFLQSPRELPRERVLRRAAAAVRPGGTLLVVGHAAGPSWATGEHQEVRFPSAREVLDSLALADQEWEELRCEEWTRAQDGPDGQPGAMTDSIVRVRRRQR